MELFNSLVILVLACNFVFVFGGPNLYARIKQKCPQPDSTTLDETAKAKDKACEATLLSLTSLSATYVFRPPAIPGVDRVDKVTGAFFKSFILENAAADCRVKDCSTLYVENRHNCIASAADDFRIGEMSVHGVLGFIDAICNQEVQDAFTSAIDDTSDVCFNKLFNPKLQAQTINFLEDTLDDCEYQLLSASNLILREGANFEEALEYFDEDRVLKAGLLEKCFTDTLSDICGNENKEPFTNFFTKFTSKLYVIPSLLTLNERFSTKTLRFRRGRQRH